MSETRQPAKAIQWRCLLDLLNGKDSVDDRLELAFSHQPRYDLQLSAARLYSRGTIVGAPAYRLPYFPVKASKLSH